MGERIRVAIDAMGGDVGIGVTKPAALDAIAHFDDLDLILVGDERLITEALGERGAAPGERLQCAAATQVIAMDEAPAHALRAKKDSSMRVAINLVRDERAQACVTAGNTGALTAIARYVLRTLAGIDRPAITTALPTVTGHTQMLDLGANVDCKAEHLFQFAVMGAVLANAVDNLDNPRVGLLNIGQETIKGNDQVKEADHQLRASSLNYIGYVEGDHIFEDCADVIVADGFIGNVALKTSEGVARFISLAVEEAFRSNLLSKIAATVSMPVLKSIARTIDPRRYNGASLLGLQGVVIKSHGGADALAFRRAIDIARIEAVKQIPKLIDTRLEEILLN